MPEPLRIDGPAALLAALADADAVNRLSVLRVLPGQAEKLAAYAVSDQRALGEHLLAQASASQALERMLCLQALAALQLRPTGAAAVYADMLSDSTESAEWPVLVALLRAHPELDLQTLEPALRAPARTWAADLVCDQLNTSSAQRPEQLSLLIAAAVRASGDVATPPRNAATEAFWARELAGPYQARAQALLALQAGAEATPLPALSAVHSAVHSSVYPPVLLPARPTVASTDTSRRTACDLLARWSLASGAEQAAIAAQLKDVLPLDPQWLAQVLDGPQRPLLVQLLLDLGQDSLLERHFQLGVFQVGS